MHVCVCVCVSVCVCVCVRTGSRLAKFALSSLEARMYGDKIFKTKQHSQKINTWAEMYDLLM